jgi:hypothetical protein
MAIWAQRCNSVYSVWTIIGKSVNMMNLQERVARGGGEWRI